MSAPRVCLEEKMTDKARNSEILKIEKWVDQNTTISHMKKAVLINIIDYAKKNIVSLPLFRDKDKIDRMNRCASIFAQVDLPDLLFLEFVKNKLSLIPDNQSKLRNCALPITNLYRDALMVPLIQQAQNIFLGVAAFGLFYGDFRFVISGLICAYCFSKHWAESRVAKKLESVLAKQLTGNIVPRIEDGWDDLLMRAGGASVGLVRSTVNAGIRLFERASAIGENNRRPALTGNPNLEMSLKKR